MFLLWCYRYFEIKGKINSEQKKKVFVCPLWYVVLLNEWCEKKEYFQSINDILYVNQKRTCLEIYSIKSFSSTVSSHKRKTFFMFLYTKCSIT